MAKYRAVYKNEAGATFSAPVEKRSDGTWVMHSSDGLQLPIDFHFTDDHAGPLIFSHYREEPEPADLRLHIDRLPGESSLGALQRAYAEKEIVEQRKHRQAARAEAQNDIPDPVKVQAARDLNNQMAHNKKPNGRGVGLVIGEKE
jgi:hypothetical protein